MQTLDPQLEKQMQQAGTVLAERCINEFWSEYERRLQSGLASRQVELPSQYKLTPYQVDQQRKTFNLAHHKLLNFNPSAYFGCPIGWAAPADFKACEFMTQFGFSRLAPYAEKIRLLTDGRVFVRAASGVWCEMVGIRYDWRVLQRPLRKLNQPRLSEVKDPTCEQFLESIKL